MLNKYQHYSAQYHFDFYLPYNSRMSLGENVWLLLAHLDCLHCFQRILILYFITNVVPCGGP